MTILCGAGHCNNRSIVPLQSSRTSVHRSEQHHHRSKASSAVLLPDSDYDFSCQEWTHGQPGATVDARRHGASFPIPVRPFGFEHQRVAR